MKIIDCLLWFDVESKYEATDDTIRSSPTRLWFDVESKYEATLDAFPPFSVGLWFDVESKYEATDRRGDKVQARCGLM